MEKFKLGLNSDRVDLHVPGSLIVAALQMADIELVPKPRWDEADLLLNVDSIHNTELFRGKKLTGYWEIDDNLHQGKNDQYYDVDLLYICSEERLFQYPKHTKFLPIAMEPTIHYKWTNIPEQHDLVFMGSLQGNQHYTLREQIINYLKEKFDFQIGTCQPQDYAKMLSAGRLLFNVLPQNEGEIPLVNARFIECMAIGCLVQNYHPVLDKFAKEGEHYVGFTTLEDAVGKVEHLLQHPEIRTKIANSGRANVLKYHTWEHRLRKIVDDAKELLRGGVKT